MLVCLVAFSTFITSLDQPASLGVMAYESGRVFEGCWENDLKHGRGYEYFLNGSWYEGKLLAAAIVK